MFTHPRPALLALSFLLAAPLPASAGIGLEQAAFPGAEGYGRLTKGGRGGRVIAVTNLNDAGPGSFREACGAEGPRTIIFQTGGTINIRRPIKVTHPFCTIAGQTAPGDGICLRGAGLDIEASEVIVRYLRVRVGDAPEGPKGDNRDAIAIAKEGEVLENVILDHCSTSWAIDENVSTWYGAKNITVQWCIISEGLYNSLHAKGPHSMGLLIGDHTDRMSVHHNLFVHNGYRNPQPKGDTRSEIVNNVVLNWHFTAIPFVDTEKRGATFADIIGNTFIPGVDSRTDTGCIDLNKNLNPGTRVFAADNTVTTELPLFNKYMDKPEYHVSERQMPDSGLVPEPAASAYERVLAQAGALAPKPDAVDLRLVEMVRKHSGKIIDSQDEVGGWPEYAAGTAPVDSDGDGLPDEWELARKLDPRNSADGALVDPKSSYTWLETYLNSLAR